MTKFFGISTAHRAPNKNPWEGTDSITFRTAEGPSHYILFHSIPISWSIPASVYKIV